MCRFFYRLKSFFLSLLLLTSFAVKAEYPGVTAGGFSVSDSGAANYSLPISVPAGVAGMSPELAVTYNSSGGNGLMGVGFGLSGFNSSIHRCGGSHATDGKASSVTYSDTDKICMNGQRLIRVSGSHWRNGAVYRSEIDNFDKVLYKTRTTSSGAPSDYFEVYTRDGEIHRYSYRATVSSTGLSAGKNVSAWLKYFEQDRSGNRIYYIYHTNLNGERWIPKEVAWGGKGYASTNRKVVFGYDTNRLDKRGSYQRGYYSKSDRRINNIKTYVDNNLVKEYRFAYQTSPVSGLSRLRYAQQCGFNGSCLPRHDFTWKDTARGFTGSTAYKLPVYVYDFQEQFEIDTKLGDFVDVNNDGLVDFVTSYKNKAGQAIHSIYRNTGSGWQRLSQKPPTGFVLRDYRIRKKNLQQGTYSDVNGDGFPDIVRAYSVVYINGTREQKKEVWINNQNWTWSRSNTFVPPTVLNTYAAGWGANRNTSIDTDQLAFRDKYNYNAMTKAHLEDINGDGRADWIVSYNNFSRDNRRGVWLNNGSRWVRTSSYDPPVAAVLDDYWEYNAVASMSVKPTRLIDINGDGLLDLVRSVRYKRGAPGTTLLDLRDTWLNTGSGWQPSTDYKHSDFALDYTRSKVQGGGSRDYLPQSRGSFVDVNSDGLVDWVRSFKDHVNNTIYKQTRLNTGKGWVTNTSYNLPGAVMNDYSLGTGNTNGHPSGSFFDMNRDGLVDWVVAYKNKAGTTVRNTYLNSGLGWRPADSNYRFPNILIDNKLGWEKRPVRYGGLMDLNGDGAVDYLMSAKNIFGNPVVATYLGKAKPADVLHTITDSLDAVTRVEYKPMTNNTVYRIGAASGYSYRNRRVTGPNLLVSDTYQSYELTGDPILYGSDGEYHLRYIYYYARSDGERGYKGFAQRRVWDPQRGILSLKDFYQEFPVTGLTKRELTYKAGAITASGSINQSAGYQLLSQQINLLKYVNTFTEQGSVLNIGRKTLANGNKLYVPLVYRTRNIAYELGQTSALSSVWTNFAYDQYANVLATRAIPVAGGAVISPNQDLTNHFYTLSQTTYSNNETNWLIGLPTSTKVTHHAPGKQNQVREAAMEYNTKGQLIKSIVEPNKPEFRITTTSNSIDGFGNVTGTTVSGQGIDNRTSTTVYDQQGMHVISKSNALGHNASEIHHPQCDAAASVTNSNGLVTSMTYDQFCRHTRTDFPDGTWSTTGFSNSPLRTIHRAKGQAEVVKFYDSLGRSIKVETKGFDGRTIIAETGYSSSGVVNRESLPYYSGDPIDWTRYYYDSIGRLESTLAVDNSVTSIAYNGFTTSTTNPLGQTQTRITDLNGRLKTVLDANDKAINYNYDAAGNLLSTTDPKGNQIKMGYDHAGRKVWMDDPDMGRWTYKYNVLGELIEQKDAKNQVIRTEYDKLGRMTERTVQPGTAVQQISTWDYDTAANGVGRLDETNGPDGYRRRHTYDTLSRPKYTYEIIDSLSMTSYQRYDTYGRVSEIRYPGRNSGGIPGYSDRITYQYNSLGYLSKVNKYDWNGGDSITEELWVAEAIDAKGNVTRERYGNGVNISRSYHPSRHYLSRINSRLGGTQIQDLRYTQDVLGNVTSRQDVIRKSKETFSYDDLNRLTRTLVSPGPNISQPGSGYLPITVNGYTTVVPLEANQSGTTSDGAAPADYNITYQYDELGNITYRSDVGIMRYGERGYGPHAITSIQGNTSANISENVYNPYGNYNYDANGNLTSNGQRMVSWTAFNKPKQMTAIIEGRARASDYTYGSDFQRITKTTLSGKKIRYYGGGAMEHTTKGSQKYWKYYIPVGAATLEINYEQTGSIHPDNFRQIDRQYVFKDNLGSSDVIVDTTGDIVERLSFSAWGERREANWDEADDEISSSTNRGFTGHEMDDEIGLVNMNARIYDPVIGRFLSPDALIPSPTDLQSYNRYSYVRNNPLSFTDPSGHVRVPGKGCGRYCTYEYEGGSFYTLTKYKPCQVDGGGCRGVFNEQSYIIKKNKITDPGLIRHLGLRIGVVQELIENHGGVHRGTAKNLRNEHRAKAAAELEKNGKTAKHQHHLDVAYAADQIYNWLKRKARKRYRWRVAMIAVTYVAPNIAAGTAGGLSGVEIATEILKDIAFDQGLSAVSDKTGIPFDTAYAVYNIANLIKDDIIRRDISNVRDNAVAEQRVDNDQLTNPHHPYSYGPGDLSDSICNNARTICNPNAVIKPDIKTPTATNPKLKLRIKTNIPQVIACMISTSTLCDD